MNLPSLYQWTSRTALRVVLLPCFLVLAALTANPTSARADTCDPNALVCTETVSTLWVADYWANQGDIVTFTTSNLTAASGGLSPDPVIFVLQGGSWTSGHTRTIVARDDDSGVGDAAAVTFVAPVSTYYSFVIASWGVTTGGYTDVNISRNGSPIHNSTYQRFGTWRRSRTLYTGDVVLAAKSPSPTQDPLFPDYHDTVLLAVPGSGAGTCNSGSCGTAHFNNDDVASMSRVEMTSTATRAMFVGTNSTGASMEARMFVLRASAIASDDDDSDGLPGEVEAVLGTCDDINGPTGSGVYVDELGKSCADFAALVDANKTCPGDPYCWDARDTDNDGLTDYEEVYGLRRCFDGIASAPYFDPGPCVGPDPSSGRCDNVCSGGYETELPISALDAPYPEVFSPPDPRLYDLLVEARYHSTLTCSSTAGSTNAHHHEPGQQYFDQMLYTLEQEGLECEGCAPPTTPGLPDCVHRDGSGNYPSGLCCPDPATDCPTDPRYQTRVHLFPEPLLQATDDRSEYMGNYPMSKGHGRYSMTGARRDSGVFRLALLTHRGGQASIPAYTFAAGNPDNGSYHANTLVHELGHTLGLQHNGRGGPNNYETNYPSLMNYAVGSVVPLKDPAWEFTQSPSSCGEDADCNDPAASQCRGADPQNGIGGYCMPVCSASEANAYNWPMRFSRGTLSNVTETGPLAEVGLERRWLRDYACDTSVPDIERRRRFVHDDGSTNAYCTGTLCYADLDRDGDWNGATQADINGRSGIQSTTQTDHDDWAYILSDGRYGLNRPKARNHDVMFFHTTFNAPDECDDGSGGCTSSCAAATTVWNRMGWQPDVLVENVQYATPPAFPGYDNGPDGLSAWFSGAGNDDRIVLDSYANGRHFDMMWDTIENIAQGSSPALDIAPRGFSIRLWARPALTVNQEYYGLIYTDKFSVYLRRLSGPGPWFGEYQVSLLVGLRTTTGYDWSETCAFETPRSFYAANGWLKLGVEFDRGNGTNGTLRARYGVSSTSTDWVPNTPLGWLEETSCGTAYGPVATGPDELGPLTIGQGVTSSYTFRGHIDDVMLFNYSHEQWDGD